MFTILLLLLLLITPIDGWDVLVVITRYILVKNCNIKKGTPMLLPKSPSMDISMNLILMICSCRNRQDEAVADLLISSCRFRIFIFCLIALQCCYGVRTAFQLAFVKKFSFKVCFEVQKLCLPFFHVNPYY